MELRGYAEAPDCEKMAENNATDTDEQMNRLLDTIMSKENLYEAYKWAVSNKSAGGVDGMQVNELQSYLKQHGEEVVQQLRAGKYKPNLIRRVETRIC